jgi:hypothetical protein
MMTYYIQYGDEDESSYPLIWCVANAFPAREVDQIDYHLEGLFKLGGAGGDPFWRLVRETDEKGRVTYWAEMDAAMSDEEPPCGHYDEALVKKYFARTMREYAGVHPESSAKIQELIDKYQLESAASPRLIAEGQVPDDPPP